LDNLRLHQKFLLGSWGEQRLDEPVRDIMIPKLIHQTAKTADMPAECSQHVAKVKALHPEWEYRLWTDRDNLDFVAREFPDFLNIFNALPRNIMRADVIRYLLMYRLGGFYLDTDYEMLKPFDLCEKDIVLCWEPNPIKPNENGKMANAIFASSPGHPFFGMMIEELKINPPLSADADVEDTTGPGLVTRVYEKAIKGGMSLFAATPELFSPLTPRNEKEYRKIVQSGVAYGIHHCHGSWRNFTLRQQLINFLSRIYYRANAS